MACEEFALNWNDHHETLVAVFENLLKRSTLVDCTIAAEGQYLKAHKVILSASSSYFELLFSQENEKNPIIILKDIKFRELKAMIEFMYRGSVKIPVDHLQDFVDAAESLQIKGLGVDQRKCNLGKRVHEVKNEGTKKDELSPRPKKRVKNSSLNKNEEKSPKSPSEVLNVSKNVISGSHSLHKIGRSVAKPSSLLPGAVSDTSAFVNVGQEKCNENFSFSADQSVLAAVSQSSHSVYDTPAFVNVGQESHESTEENISSAVDHPSVFAETETVIKTEPEDEHVPESVVSDNLVEPKKEVCEQEEITILDSDDEAEESLEADGIHDENSQQLSSFPQTREPVLGDSFALEGLEHSNTQGSQWSCADEGEWASSSWQSRVDTNTTSIIEFSSLKGVYLEDKRPITSSDALSSLDTSSGRVVERVHPGATHMCRMCGLELMSPSKLTRHMRCHTGERPFICPQCKKSFSRLDHLRIHQRTHTGIRPYRCGVCEKTFSLSHHLRLHQRIHTGDRPYKCGVCEKTFARLDNLKVHQNTH